MNRYTQRPSRFLCDNRRGEYHFPSLPNDGTSSEKRVGPFIVLELKNTNLKRQQIIEFQAVLFVKLSAYYM